MRSFRFIFILSVIIFALHVQPVFAQDNLRSQLFNESDQALAKAKEKKADLYAPNSFEKAMEYYNDGSDYYANGKKLEDIREKLKNAAAYFYKAIDECKPAEILFIATMSARSDAASAGAQKYSAKLWNTAEEQFKKAALKLEDDNKESAKEVGREAEMTFRAAELEAIKANYLSPARELLKNADDMGVKDNAPRTLQRAKTLSLQVEELLKQNRYDTDSARQLAQEAKYEAAHAIYLHHAIERMKQQDKNFEDAMLEDEANFQRAAAELGVLARFDNGYNTPIAEVKAAVKDREAKAAKNFDLFLSATDSIRLTNQTVKQKDNEIENLKQQIALMEKRVGTLTEAEQKLKQTGTELEHKLAITEQQEGTIRQVSGMFTTDEGNVLRDGNNIVIRLYGLTFPSGKSIIEQQFYPLLTKVQEAIKKFPNCKVAIEGHTDSQGSDEVNQKLSGNRATAVAEYLMANMGVQIPINAEGYGESRPVASSDSPEGRAKNRRIDVVITPAWASEGK